MVPSETWVEGVCQVLSPQLRGKQEDAKYDQLGQYQKLPLKNSYFGLAYRE